MAPARLKVRDSGQVMVEICDELEEAVKSCLIGAPFATISIVLRYVSDSTESVEIGKINRHAELEVGIDVPTSNIKSADRGTLKEVFRCRVIRALQIVNERFDLHCEFPAAIGRELTN